jgi:acetyl esterase
VTVDTLPKSAPEPLLDPHARALINLVVEQQVPPVHLLAPEQARQMYRERCRGGQEDPPPVAGVQEILVPGLPARATPLPCRLYLPPLPPAAAPAPLLVYFHGGGWTIGDLDTHDVLCRQLCVGAGVAVLSVDYRLAPEHRFPAAFDDALAATRWAQTNGAALAAWGVNHQCLAIGGDSAGGNLAAAVALALRDEPTPAAAGLRFQLLLYPVTDLRALSPSYTRCAQGYLLTADSMAYYRGHYCPEPGTWRDWRASPLLAASHADLPEALVVTAGFDPLCDEGRQYADALSRAGSAARYVCFERNVHGFAANTRINPEGRLAVALACAALRAALA